MNIQDRFPLGLTGLISLLSKGLSRVFSSTTVQKASILCCSAFFMAQFSNPNMTTGKTIALMSTYAFISFPGGSEVKASASNVGNLGLIPGLGRSPGEGNGNPLQCSCLENSKDRGQACSPWGHKESDTTK